MSSHVKDIKDLIRKARKNGWQIELTNGGHYRWTWTNGEFFYMRTNTGGLPCYQENKMSITKRRNGKTYTALKL